MKKFLIIITMFLCGLNIWISFANWTWWDNTNDIYTKDKNDVIKDNDLDDPLRNGTTSAVENVDWVINVDTSTNEQNQDNLIKYISKWLNYFLALLGLVVTIFIIKEWYTIVTAWSNESIQKESLQDIKNYIIALIWIGVSYMLINLIFHFININSV